MPTARAPINGQTLTWARESLNIDVAELARILHVKTEALRSWESGDASPTANQLRQAAAILERTPAFFFIEAPEDTGVPVVADFRGYVGSSIPTNVLREMKRAEQHRRTLIELDGNPDQRLQLDEFGSQDVVEAATAVRRQLRAHLPSQMSSKPLEVFNAWRAALEAVGVLVFQTTRVPLSAFRGLSIYHHRYPIILVNGADAANGKIFTLFHELGHLSNRRGGVCIVVNDSSAEQLCNVFAAEVLMPAAAVQALLAETESDSPVKEIASRFRVSNLAAAIRLRTLNLISETELEQQREKSDAEWQSARDQLAASDGFVPPWTLRTRDLGQKYVGAVMAALDRNQIDYLGAAYVLNARIPVIERMRQDYQRRGGA